MASPHDSKDSVPAPVPAADGGSADLKLAVTAAAKTSTATVIVDGEAIDPDAKGEDYYFVRDAEDDMEDAMEMSNAAAIAAAAKAGRDEKAPHAPALAPAVAAAAVAGGDKSKSVGPSSRPPPRPYTTGVDVLGDVPLVTAKLLDIAAAGTVATTAQPARSLLSRLIVRIIVEYWYHYYHVSRGRDITRTGDPDDDDRYLRIRPCIPAGVRLVSIQLSFRWRDQGWGNRKGEIWLRLLRVPPPPPPLPVLSAAEEATRAELRAMGIDDPDMIDGPPIGPQPAKFGTRIVIADDRPFGLAPHEWEARSRTFDSDQNCSAIVTNARSGDTIEIWKTVGGGGGHRLSIHDFMGGDSSKETLLGGADGELPDNERFYGYENYGNTCYVNSVLQALYAIVPFRLRVLEYYDKHKSHTKETDNLLMCLATLWHKIATSKKRVGIAAPARFVELMRGLNPQFNGLAHQDAHEFLSYLLNDVADTIKKSNAAAPATPAAPAPAPSPNNAKQSKSPLPAASPPVPAGAPQLSPAAAAAIVGAAMATATPTAATATATATPLDSKTPLAAASNGATPTTPALTPHSLPAASAAGAPMNGAGGIESKETAPPARRSPPFGATAASAVTTTAGTPAATAPTPAAVSFPPAASWVQQLFEGTLTNEIRCMRCENVTSRAEQFMELSLDIAAETSVTHALRSFSAPERLWRSDKYSCELCCMRQEASKCMKVARLPPVLILQLKRFKYIERLESFQKLYYRVSFPFTLRLTNTASDAAVRAELTSYALTAVVVHIGSGTKYGHYVCFVRTTSAATTAAAAKSSKTPAPASAPNRWLLYDDDDVRVVTDDHVTACFGSQHAGGRGGDGYLLFYSTTT